MCGGEAGGGGEPEHPCLLTQFCVHPLPSPIATPSISQPVREWRREEETGSGPEFWTGGPGRTAQHPAWGNLVQKDTQSWDISSGHSLPLVSQGPGSWSCALSLDLEDLSSHWSDGNGKGCLLGSGFTVGVLGPFVSTCPSLSRLVSLPELLPVKVMSPFPLSPSLPEGLLLQPIPVAPCPAS